MSLTIGARSNLHFRPLLLLLFNLRKSVTEAHQTRSQAYGNAAPSHSDCWIWFQRFKIGDTNLLKMAQMIACAMPIDILEDEMRRMRKNSKRKMDVRFCPKHNAID